MDDQNKSVNERWAPAQEPTERGYATEGDPRTAQIRSEIDRTRADMSETIDEIQDRITPRNVVSRTAERVRDATVGKVRDVADTVQQRMPSSSGQWTDGGFVERVRENPVPAAIAAASLAWLAFGGRRQRRQDRDRAIYGSTAAGEPFIRETRIDTSSTHSPLENVAEYGASIRERAGAAIERTEDAAHRAGSRMRRATWQAQHGVERLTNGNPLAAGAIAAAIGVAIGLALPESERENELMGEARDSLVDRSRETVRDAADRVRGAADEVQRAASRTIRSTGSNTSDVRGADNP